MKSEPLTPIQYSPRTRLLRLGNWVSGSKRRSARRFLSLQTKINEDNDLQKVLGAERD